MFQDKYSGIRFKPKDEELIVFYLKPKVDEQPVPPSEINIVDFYQYDPQTLADEHPSRLGQKEWYFFTYREKKYQNGKRPNRSAGNGYWKATAADKPIQLDQTEQIIGYKKTLVYYEGDHKYSRKTDWIMHEYKLPIADPTPKTEKLPEDENDMRLDSWVLCRIHKRETKSNKPPPRQHHHQQQLLQQQQQMDYQQQQQHNPQQQQQMDYQQQQHNPFPLVDEFFPEDDVYYGQYDLQPPQQMRFQPQPRQQDEGFQPQQQQDGFFQPRQQDFQPQQQQDGLFCFIQPQQDEESEYIASLLQNFV